MHSIHGTTRLTRGFLITNKKDMVKTMSFLFNIPLYLQMISLLHLYCNTYFINLAEKVGKENIYIFGL